VGGSSCDGGLRGWHYMVVVRGCLTFIGQMMGSITGMGYRRWIEGGGVTDGFNSLIHTTMKELEGKLSLRRTIGITSCRIFPRHLDVVENQRVAG